MILKKIIYFNYKIEDASFLNVVNNFILFSETNISKQTAHLRRPLHFISINVS